MLAMKNLIPIRGLGFLILMAISYSCKKEELPALSTGSVINITATTASSGGNITSDGGAGVTARGVCWGENANPTIMDSKTVDGNGTGQYTSTLTGLTAGSLFHVRAYATNSVGTAYGVNLSFTTLGKSPESITQPAANIGSSEATLNGTVNANDLSTAVTFDYGLSTSYGQTTTAAQSPLTGNSIKNVSASISGLAPGTTYHYRVKSVNSIGTAYGNDLTFITVSLIPVIINAPVSNVTANSATTGGNITSDGGASITARGVCWATTPDPTTENSKTSDGTGTGSFTSKISCLSGTTTYYIRAYATNSVGTAYGEQQSFTTKSGPVFNPDLTYGSVSDIDGNCYKTIQIGDQVWMAENLKTTRYNDGTPIPIITDSIEWASLPFADWVGDPWPLKYVTYGAYCWYNNDEATYENTYGKLYNWGAVGTKKLCPAGWHVPSSREWLVVCHDETDWGSGPYGEELMEAGATHWETSVLSGTNETGFTALPGGVRDQTGTFSGISQKGSYWAGDELSYPGYKYSHPIYFYARAIEHHFTEFLFSERNGFSVRCLKDQ